jgi:general secretion pathway protein N
MAGTEMKPGRAFALLTGVALLGAIARFNEMTPDAQASLLGAAAKTARTTAESLLHGAVESYNEMTAPESAAPQPAAPPSAAPQPAASRPAAPQPRVAAPPPAEEGKEGASAPPRQVAALTARAGEPETPSGNPLWTLPLKQLSMTRDRPIFSPSRRPPPKQTLVAPVAVRQVKPAEPERPTVSLLGTIIGSKADDQIGVFIDSATQNVIRLRVGEDHEGWVLRLVKARQATLVKDGEVAVVLDLPAPGEGGGFGSMPPPGGMPGMPPGGIVGTPKAPGGVAQNPNIPNPASQAQTRQQYQQQLQQRRQQR